MNDRGGSVIYGRLPSNTNSAAVAAAAAAAAVVDDDTIRDIVSTGSTHAGWKRSNPLLYRESHSRVSLVG